MIALYECGRKQGEVKMKKAFSFDIVGSTSWSIYMMQARCPLKGNKINILEAHQTLAVKSFPPWQLLVHRRGTLDTNWEEINCCKH